MRGGGARRSSADGAAADIRTRRVAALDGEIYRTALNALDQGFCLVEVILAAGDGGLDVHFVEVNPAFERITGLRDAVGTTARQALPGIEPEWLATFERIARSGAAERFVGQTEALGESRWFDVYAFRLGGPDTRNVAIHFADVTQRKLTEEELRQRSEQFRTLVEQAPLGVILLDSSLRVVDVNRAARPLLGDITDPLGRDFGEMMHSMWPAPLADEIVRAHRHTLETGQPHHEEELTEVRLDRGVKEYLDWHVERILLPDGRFGVACYFSDVSRQVEARRALAVSEERYRTLFESIDDGFCILQVIFDAEGPVDFRYLETNPAFERQSGIRNALGRTIRELVPDIEPSWIDVYGAVATTGEAKRFVEYSGSMRRWFDVYAFRTGEPHEHKVALLLSDITERKEAEEALLDRMAQLSHHAHHDALTGLPNRVLFDDRLKLALVASARYERMLAVLFIDLDGFKGINDNLGHAAGDAVLEEVAGRLAASLRQGDTLARLHGDEFVALLPELSARGDAGVLARALLVQISRPIAVADTQVTVSASIGVSVFPYDAEAPVDLLRAADAAMYRAKLAGKNALAFFASSLRPIDP